MTGADDETQIRSIRVGAVARVVLDNPAKRNALSLGMLRELPRLLAGLDEDPAVAGIVISGAGDTFCAGVDLSSWEAAADPSEPDRLVLRLQDALDGLATPTIAAIRGHAIGGGCLIAAACDFRLAIADARLGVPAARLGVVYAASGLRSLTSLVGPVATKRMLYLGVPIPADEAAGIGLVDRIVDDDALDAEAVALAESFSSRSAVTIGATKQLLRAIAAGEPTDGIEARGSAVALAGERDEGVAAARGKRSPAFPSRAPRPTA